MPCRASSSTQTTSASCAPLHAVDTMARSSLRFGEKIPGVSTRMIWAVFSSMMPRISATKPQRVALGGASSGALSIAFAAGHAFTRDHDRRGSLFGGSLAAADAFGRRHPLQIHGDAELRIVMA